MRRITWATVAGLMFLGQAAAQEPPKVGPITSKRVSTTAAASTLALAVASITKQSGIDFDLSAVDGGAKIEPIATTDFWLAAEALAKQTGTRFNLNTGKLKFAKGPAAPSSVDGPFRVSVKQVVAKRDFDADRSVYDVLLEVSWEPRFPVYLIDDVPKITAATAGMETLKVTPSTGRVPTVGFRQLATVRLQGVPRSAATIDVLSGSFNVVAAEKLLAVEFKDLTGDKPLSQTLDGVKVTLAPAKRIANRVQFDFNLEYPPSHPDFESYEQWASANTLKLYAPNNRNAYETTDYAANETGRRISVSYSYDAPVGKPAPLADLKGWRAVYETAGPMVTQSVKFELKGIVLP